MKNTIISLSIFFVMILGIFFSLNYLNNICVKLEVINSQIEKDINNKSWDKAYENSLKFLYDWEKYAHKVSIFTNHAEIDNVNNELWKLTQYTKSKSEEESLASSHVLRFLLEHIVKLEKVNMENIL